MGHSLQSAVHEQLFTQTRTMRAKTMVAAFDVVERGIGPLNAMPPPTDRLPLKMFAINKSTL